MTTLAELGDFRAELTDRFGPPPPMAERLLARAELAILAQSWQIDSMHLEDAYVVFTYKNRTRIEELAGDKRGCLRVVDGRSAYLPMGQQDTTPDALYELVKSVLHEE